MASASVFAQQASAYFILEGSTLALDRQDAIVSPGVNVVAQHVHNLVGVSAGIAELDMGLIWTRLPRQAISIRILPTKASRTVNARLFP